MVCLLLKQIMVFFSGFPLIVFANNLWWSLLINKHLRIAEFSVSSEIGLHTCVLVWMCHKVQDLPELLKT